MEAEKKKAVYLSFFKENDNKPVKRTMNQITDVYTDTCEIGLL